MAASGTATVSQDRQVILDLYRKDGNAWFGDDGGARDGGPDAPRLALIVVDVESVTFLGVDTPKPVVLFEVAKGMVAGTPPDVGTQRTFTGEQVDRGAGGRHDD